MLKGISRINRYFGFLKNLGQREVKLMNDNQIPNFSKDLRKDKNQNNAIKIDLSKLKLENLPDTEQLINNVPQLKHGLDKYLNGQLVFGDQGVGQLPQQNQQTANQQIARISKYIRPCQDNSLISKALQQNCKYVSSTSSISSPLVALYFMFSNFRYPQTDNLFEGLSNKPLNWMISYRKPITFYLYRRKDGTQIIQSDPGMLPKQNQVLMNLGHVIEYFLTHEKQQTQKVMKGQPTEQTKNYYRYAKVNNEIMLRSQIDCLSFDKNGNPYVFQIKSRACAPIRYDVQNYKLYTDYQINSKRNLYQSFQRQYFDLIRGGFLKYVIQVKIGGMNGAFIAYHNTEKIYGYQYVDAKQMALRVFGDQYNLDISFVTCCKMLTIILDHLKKSLPEHKQDQLKIGFYSDNKSNKLIVMVQPMSVVKQYIPLKKMPQGTNSIADYLTNSYQIKNPVYKYEFDFFIYLNGLRLNNPQILLTPLDTLQVKYHISQKYRVCSQQYICFLHHAYKDQQIYNSQIYRGIWGNPQMQNN